MRQIEHLGYEAEYVDGHREVEDGVAQSLAPYCGRGGHALHLFWVYASVAAPALARCASEERDAEYHTLLEYENDDTGYDERGESLLGVAQEVTLAFYRRGGISGERLQPGHLELLACYGRDHLYL